MKIGIDARTMGYYPGMGRYCSSIIEALAKMDKVNKYIVYVTKRPDMPSIQNPNFIKIVVEIPPLSLGTLFRFSKVLARDKLDIFFAPFYISPWTVPCRMVLTVHDMMDRSFPDIFAHHPFPVSSLLKVFYRIVTWRSIKNASCIIAVSEFTKQEILRYHSIPGDKIVTIHEGVNNKFKQVTEADILYKIKTKYNLPSEYVLFLGTTKYYKNIHRLLEGFAHHIKNKPKGEMQLVIAGMRNVLQSDLMRMAEYLGISERISFVGAIEEDDLAALYSGAKVFILPSLYEGFGLPALEAMACGTPVIVSNVSSLPEIVGNAAFFVNPYDAIDIYRALDMVLSNPALQQNLRQLGLEHVKKFSWDTAVKKTLDIFEEIYNAHS